MLRCILHDFCVVTSVCHDAISPLRIFNKGALYVIQSIYVPCGAVDASLRGTYLYLYSVFHEMNRACYLEARILQ